MTGADVWDLVKKIKEKKPLVHCITNIVTVNDCANILLSVGASPTMAHHPLEVEEVVEKCDSLVLNLGATENLEAMIKAGKKAGACGRPIVLDPVGVAGSSFRRAICQELIGKVDPLCIRGNLSEICALALDENTGAGVDECRDSAWDAEERKAQIALVKTYAKQQHRIVIASGSTDIISDGEAVYTVSAGADIMAKITGAGCMSTALLGAFLAVRPDIMGAFAACITMGRCGELAWEHTRQKNGGTGTFHMELMDRVFLLKKEELLHEMKYEPFWRAENE